MESFEFEIEKAAGLIIEEQGIHALTIEALERHMRIPIRSFSRYLKKDDEILKFMALRLKNEIQQLINNLASLNHEPEKELTDLFKGLYDYFNRKSYFLDLMFDDLVHENNSSAQVIILEIRNKIEIYLKQVIEQGKNTGTFKSHVETSHEVKSVLNRFRLFMSDIPLTHKMIRDLKWFREKNN